VRGTWSMEDIITDSVADPRLLTDWLPQGATPYTSARTLATHLLCTSPNTSYTYSTLCTLQTGCPKVQNPAYQPEPLWLLICPAHRLVLLTHSQLSAPHRLAAPRCKPLTYQPEPYLLICSAHRPESLTHTQSSAPHRLAAPRFDPLHFSQNPSNSSALPTSYTHSTLGSPKI